MSLITQAFVVEKYGVRLPLDKLSELLGISKGTIHNQISAATFPIPTYLDGGKRFADYRDVAAHLDACQKQAA